MSAEGLQEHPPAGITLVGPAHSEPQQVAKAGALADRADDVFEAASKLLASLPRGLRNRRRTTPKYSDAVGKGDTKAKDEKKKKKGDLKDGAKLGGLVAEKFVKDAALEPERPKFWTLVEVKGPTDASILCVICHTMTWGKCFSCRGESGALMQSDAN
jgi:hypothetical protein